MNVVQSYFTTIMKGNFSLYEIRIFIKIVEHANKLLHGKSYSALIGRSVCLDGLNCNLSIPIRSVLAENCNDYGKIKSALKNLGKKTIEFYNPQSKTWHFTAFISNIKVADGDGLIHFTVAKWLLEYILNFVNCNYTMYNLEKALSLQSPYSVRMYWLTCNMGHDVSYSIPMLREMLGVGEKYKQTKDFIKRCIQPAALILKDSNMNGFTFVRNFNNGKVTSLTLHPVVREEPSTTQNLAHDQDNKLLDSALTHYLTSQCGFSARELASNKAILMQFTMIASWQDMIVKIVGRYRKKRATKGYIIGAIKSAVNEQNPGAKNRHQRRVADVAQRLANQFTQK